MSFLTGIFGKVGIYLVLVVVGLIALAIVARNWSCRQHHERPDPVNGYTVDHVETGNRIEVEAGWRGHKMRSVVLHGIGTPTADPLAEQSRANLETLAGETIRAEILDGHEHGSGEIDAVVWGEHGAHCQIEQLRAGLAWVTDTKYAAWLKVEAEARKAKRGIWAKKKSGQSATQEDQSEEIEQ